MTAGPTYEPIDPVRFIGNYSSGRMGIAIANELFHSGAEVTLICGPAESKDVMPGIRFIPVVTAEEMFNSCMSLFPDADGAILTAAVADFRPASPSKEKIKKNKDGMVLSLEPTRDIAATLGKIKKQGQFLAGFALETNDELNNALKKLESKNFDFIVLNSLKDKGAGFKYDTNKITIIDRDNKITNFKLKPKTGVAHDIACHLANLLSC